MVVDKMFVSCFHFLFFEGAVSNTRLVVTALRISLNQAGGLYSDFC